MRSFVTLLSALGACVGSVLADDVLFSKRASPLHKRSIDDQGNWNVSFFHVNDVHAHLDEFSSSGTDCKNPDDGCYGGYARIKTKVDELKEAHPDNLWLNAGDEFQGTLFYTFYGGEKIAETINDLGFDAMTLGNHEWDGGDQKLGEFLNNLTFPIISCNVKSEHRLLKKNIKNYHVFEKKNLAIIGASTTETPSISSVGNQTKFLDPIEEVQKAVDEIQDKYPGVKYIVVLTHLGYDVDQKLAKNTTGISLIIGGHSHTLLGDMKGAEGKYPTIVENKDGDEVFVVTSYRWGEYLGSINMLYDEDGKVLGYHGAPIHLTNSTKQDKELQEKIDSWRGPFEKFAAKVLGTTDAKLVQDTCQDGDCLLGQVMSDAMLEYRQNQTSGEDAERPDFALINSGVVRAEIDEGNITRGEVLTSFPFGNSVVELKYTGKELRSIFEGCVSLVNQKSDREVSSWFQVSKGIVIEYNPHKKKGNRLVSVKVNGKPLKDDQEYRMVTLDFLAGGGDNILEETNDFATLDLQEEVLVQYIKARSPLSPELKERVVKVDKQPGDDESGDGDDGNGGSGAGMVTSSVYTAMTVMGVAMADIYV